MIFPFNRYPFTSYTDINLDWIMKKLKEAAPAGEDNPVSYDPQSPSLAEQAQARDNIGIDYPVTSVNSQTGDVVITIPANVSDLVNDSGFVDAAGAAAAAPVQSVNGQTGTVSLTASDVGALPDDYTPPAAPVSSVNGQTGTVSLTASDVGALADSYTAPVTSVNSKTGAVTLTAPDVGAPGITREQSVSANGSTSYDLTGSSYTNFIFILGSPSGSDNNSMYFVNTTYNQVRLLGNAANNITISCTSGVVTIGSANYSTAVWIMTLPAS